MQADLQLVAALPPATAASAAATGPPGAATGSTAGGIAPDPADAFREVPKPAPRGRAVQAISDFFFGQFSRQVSYFKFLRFD